MGTAVRLVTDPDSGMNEAIERAAQWLQWVDRTFSVHQTDSQVMRIRNGTLAESDAHREVVAVLGRCTALRIVSDGRFDHQPERDLDPSGYVKGWAVERAAAILENAGLARFCIDAGGDIAVRGRWNVGIRNPEMPAQTLVGLELVDRAIATSGTYERGEHIWGEGPGNLASVSVIGPDLGTADAMSTALFASQGRDIEWLDRFPGYEVVAITKDLEVLTPVGATSTARLFRSAG